VFPDKFSFPVSQGTDSLIDPLFLMPYVHEMNLTLEQQIKGRQSLSIGYVGALGHHLLAPVLYPPNRVNAAYLGNGTIGDTVTVARNTASSNYHALQGKFQRQFSRGLGFIASYTWSHSIDTQSTGNGVTLNNGSVQFVPTISQLTNGIATGLTKASSDFDVRHNFALSVVYETRRAGSSLRRSVLGGWTLAPIYHYQTAMPIDIITLATATLGGAVGLGQRPNLIPGVPVYATGSTCAGQYTAAGRAGLCPADIALNTAPPTAAQLASAGCASISANTPAKGAFCTPLPVGGQAVSGNAGRNIARAFPLQELDFSLQRDFPIRESVRLRFQADMFNVFNHPNFGPFGANMSTPTFGFTGQMANSFLGASSSSGAGFNPIFSTGGPRNYQFALKLFF
jgi:hypothetical protein